MQLRVRRRYHPEAVGVVIGGSLTLLATITLWAYVWKPMDLLQAEAWLGLTELCLVIVRRNRHRWDSQASNRSRGRGEVRND